MNWLMVSIGKLQDWLLKSQNRSIKKPHQTMRSYFFFNLNDYFFFLLGAGALAEATAAERSAPALNLATVLASMLIGFLVGSDD